MKKIFTKLMLWAVAATALVSCENNFEDATVNGGELTQTVTLTAEKPAEVRTELIEGVPYWSNGDKIGVYTTQAKDADNYAFANDNNEATLTTSFTGQTAISNTLFVYYPYTTNGIAIEGAKVDIPVNQNPTATSFDGKADLMIAKPVTLDASGKQLSNLEFARLGAIVKIVLKDNTSSLAGQHVSSLTMTAATDLTGRVYLDVENQELGELYYGQSKSVTATYSEATQYEVNGTNATYVVVYPQTLKSGSKLTVKAATEGYTITKEITLSQDIELAMSKVTTLNVSLSATEIEKNEIVEWVNNAYNLIPSTAYLEVGDKVVIVANSYAKGMGLWADGNNCPAVNVTKNTENKTVAIDGSVAVLSVEAGKTAGSFAFKSSKGYLYAASSSSNYLKAEATLTTNSSWSVSIVDGIATVKALGGNTRNWMRYNNSNAIFSCYASGQTDICIYKLVGEYIVKDPAISFSVENVTITNDATSGSATVTATNATNWTITPSTTATWIKSISYASNKISFTTEVNESEESRSATVTVTATREGYDNVQKTFTITQNGKPAAGAKSWVRVTSVDMILEGGTFIIGYEASANSGKLVPMRSDKSGATTTSNGYHYAGTSASATGNGTIDMKTITDTSAYEFTISASTTVSNAVDIKRPDGTYIGNSNAKNTARLYASVSKNTAYGVSMGTNNVVTLTCAAASSYPTLQYNTSSPRFANYNKTQKNLVFYKLQ